MRPRLSSLLLDLAAVAAAWAFVVCVFRAWGYRLAYTPLFVSIVVVGLGNVAWLPFRLMGLLGRLAWRERREELALTLLPAEEYLQSRLRGPLLQAAMPMLTVCPLLGVWGLGLLATGKLTFSAMAPLSPGETLLLATFVPLCLLLVAASYLLVRLSIMVLLGRACRANIRAGDSAPLSLWLWAIPEIELAALAPFFGLALIGMMFSQADEWVVVIGLVYGVGLCWAISRSLTGSWRDVAGQYYHFED